MGSITYARQSIFNVYANAKGHQCNCVTKEFAGLAKDVFDQYPALRRFDDRQMGEIYYYVSNPYEILPITWFNMYCQVYPGKSKFTNDTPTIRLWAFNNCLVKIHSHIMQTMKNDDLPKLALPYLIGCGLGGGKWLDYLGVIEEFVMDRRIEVILCVKPN